MQAGKQKSQPTWRDILAKYLW